MKKNTVTKELTSLECILFEAYEKSARNYEYCCNKREEAEAHNDSFNVEVYRVFACNELSNYNCLEDIISMAGLQEKFREWFKERNF